jgi:hypothetical protein
VFQVNLANPSNAMIADGSDTGTIVDDDGVADGGGTGCADASLSGCTVAGNGKRSFVWMLLLAAVWAVLRVSHGGHGEIWIPPTPTPTPPTAPQPDLRSTACAGRARCSDPGS